MHGGPAISLQLACILGDTRASCLALHRCLPMHPDSAKGAHCASGGAVAHLRITVSAFLILTQPLGLGLLCMCYSLNCECCGPSHGFRASWSPLCLSDVRERAVPTPPVPMTWDPKPDPAMGLGVTDLLCTCVFGTCPIQVSHSSYLFLTLI